MRAYLKALVAVIALVVAVLSLLTAWIQLTKETVPPTPVIVVVTATVPQPIPQSTSAQATVTSLPHPSGELPTATPATNLSPRPAYSVTRAEVESWHLGEVIQNFQSVVQGCLDNAHAGPRPYISFKVGDTIPASVLIATDFKTNKLLLDGTITGICHSGSWGLFESKTSFTAISEGAYWNIITSSNIPSLTSSSQTTLLCLPTQYTSIGNGWTSGPMFVSAQTGGTKTFTHCPPMTTIKYDSIAVDDEISKVELVCGDGATDISAFFTPFKVDGKLLLHWRSSRIELKQNCRIDFTIKDSAGVNIGLMIKESEP